MFPPDTQTFAFEIVNAGSSTIFTSGGTILSADIQQSGAQSTAILRCDGSVVGKSYTEHYDALFNKYCNTLTAEKTGTGNSTFFTVLYIPRTPTSSYIYPSMTYGDITSITFNYWVLGLLITSLLIGLTKVWRTRKNYD